MAVLYESSLFLWSEVAELGDLERLKLTLEGIEDEELMQFLEQRRGNGRDDYPVRVMWNLLIALKVCGHPTVESFRRELGRNSQLRKICGLDDYANKKHLVPPARVFSKFLATLEEESVLPLVNKIFETQVEFLYNNLPDFGENLAGDGKYLDSYAKKSQSKIIDPDDRTEKDAEFSIKEYHYIGTDGKQHTKKETHYGFRAHVVCDVATELPVAFSVMKANFDEKKAMIEMLENFSESQIARAETLALDRGYDSVGMIKLLKNLEILPIIDIRNMWKDVELTRQYKDTNIVYNAKGEVFYVNNMGEEVKMKYKGYDKNKKCLRYSHEDKIYKIYISYDERIFLPVARDSEKFKKLYNGRTTIERLNGRIDRDYLFEDHTIRGLGKMNLMFTISMIVMNGMAIGKTKNNLSAIRSLKKVS